MEILEKEETIALRKKHLGDALTVFFANSPLKIVRASGQYMYDENDNQYLDCINNVCHVGHCHPEVVKAGFEQMRTLNTNSRYLHDNIVRLAAKITATMPEQLCVVYFCNSGSEANDLALRMAKHYTKHSEIITVDHAYHGHLSSIIDISPYKLHVQTDGVHVCPPHVYVTACPDVYRGKYTNQQYTEEELSEKYAEEVGDIIKVIQARGRNVCTFISESMQSCGGQIVFPKDYLKKVYRSIHEAGGVCIADEVQVGFGRVGSHMWAFQTQGVVPDIVTLGKPMGNGHPVSAVVTTREISKAFKDCGMAYFNTFGGNPVSCAIALKVLEVMEQEGLQRHALEVGNYMIDKGQGLMSKFPMVGDVRGAGLFIGFDLVRNRKTREPATEEARFIVRRMKEDYRIILSTDGPYDNVLKMKPPMCFSIENCDQVIEKLAILLKEIENLEFQSCPGWAMFNASKHGITKRSLQLKASL